MRQIFQVLPWIPPKELPETLGLFRRYGVPAVYGNGELLKHKGEAKKLFLITEGTAAYYVADRYKSHPSVLNLLIPGRSACDLSAITGDRVNVTTRAIGNCQVLMMQPDVLMDYVSASPDFAVKQLRHVTKKQECSIEAMVANFTLEPEERLRRLLKVVLVSSEMPPVYEDWNRIPIDLTNEQYGAVVNLTRVSVSRIFSEWTTKMLLKKSGKNIWVHGKLLENIDDWCRS